MGKLHKLSGRYSLAEQARWQRAAAAYIFLFLDARQPAALVSRWTTDCVLGDNTRQAMESLPHFKRWWYSDGNNSGRGCNRGRPHMVSRRQVSGVRAFWRFRGENVH